MKIARRRFAALKAALTPKVKPIMGRCNYPLSGGTRFCKIIAGKRTAHPGSGYCVDHDNRIPYDPVHRYRKIGNSAIRNQFKKLDTMERNIFDLMPEVTLMRALMVDYVERFYMFRTALMAWYKDGKQKPRMALDITEAAHLIEAVSRLIERQHRIERSGSIDLETFRRATEQMGIIVAKHVRDGKVLKAIEDEWSQVSLDSKSSLTGLPTAARETQQLEAGNDAEAHNP